MAQLDEIPPPPEGFVLEASVPPPPPGFIVIGAQPEIKEKKPPKSVALPTPRQSAGTGEITLDEILNDEGYKGLKPDEQFSIRTDFFNQKVRNDPGYLSLPDVRRLTRRHRAGALSRRLFFNEEWLQR